MKKSPLIAAAVGALLVTGCDKAGTDANKGAATPTPEVVTVSSENAIAIVNGKPISRASIDIVTASQRRGGAPVPEEKIVEEVIKREILRQEAESEGLTKDPKYAAHLETAQRMILAQAAMEHFSKGIQVSDEELKKQYEEKIGPMKMAEFKARHILVKTEQAAKDLIAKLQKGEKFEALAKKFSTDPGSKDKGGDLGWFSPKQMVAPFSEAVMALKNGETAKTPVQSEFGWHVIQREDSREQTPPPFEAVKEQLRSFVQNEKLQQHIAELQSKAKIENRAATKPAPPAASAPPTPGLEAGKPLPSGAKPAPSATPNPAPATPAPAEPPQAAPKTP